MKKYGVEISFVIEEIKGLDAQHVVQNILNKLNIPGHVLSDLKINAFEHTIFPDIPEEDEKYFVPTDKQKEEIVDRIEKMDSLKMAEDIFKHEDLRIKNGAPDPSEHLTDPDYYDFSDLGPNKEEWEDEDNGI